MQVYLNISLSIIQVGKKIRVKPLAGQQVDKNLFVSCSRQQRSQMQIGTVFQSDVKLIQPQSKKPYLKTIQKVFGQLRLF
jgi:hypothetical protein